MKKDLKDEGDEKTKRKVKTKGMKRKGKDEEKTKKIKKIKRGTKRKGKR
jgi:hypothetical protein